ERNTRSKAAGSSELTGNRYLPLFEAPRRPAAWSFKRIMAVFGLSIALFASVSATRAETVDRVVAIINDSIITLSELNAATAVAIDRLGVKGAEDKRKVDEVKSTILDTLIEQRLVKQAADRAGIEVSEREIDNAVEDVKKQNEMTQEQLMLALAQSGLTHKEYREQLREQIRQVKFINKEFRSKISIAAEDIEDYYRQNAREFSGQSVYRMNMIVLPSGDRKTMEERLKLVAGGLEKGEDFRQLASHYSEGPSPSLGGDLGYLKSGEMESWIEEAAMKLKPGQASSAIERKEGIYFIQLTEHEPAMTRPLSEVKGLIQDRLFKKIMDERFNFWLSEVKRYAHLEIRM
ncbi:partial Chaperone SurA, partial [Anaerolineae bacterium]